MKITVSLNSLSLSTKILLVVFFLGVFIRLYGFIYTPVINDDGTLYVHQARALLSGTWESARTCGFPYLSIYPFFIIPFYLILGDWIMAAQSVSLVFGALSLIPVFFIARLFFDDKIAGITASLYAIMPILVQNSISVIKDPISWFFCLLGLYFFMDSFKKNRLLYLPLSSIFMCIALFSRIESVSLIISSYLFLLFIQKQRRVKTLLFFSIPIIALIIVALLGLIITDQANFNIVTTYLIPKITVYINSLNNYTNVVKKLEEVQRLDSVIFPHKFLMQIKDVLWFIPAAILLKKIIKAFFLPFFIVFIIGLGNVKEKIRQDPLLAYMALVFVSTLFILYAYYLVVWVTSTRYTVILLFSAIPFVGFGVQKLFNFFSQKRTRKIIGLILAISIAGVTVSSDLKIHRKSKVVLKEIGEYIASLEPQRKEIPIAAYSTLIPFYANLDKHGSPCPLSPINYTLIVNKNCKDTASVLHKNAIPYLVWEETRWKSLVCSKDEKELIKLREWKTKKNKKIILYRLP